MVDGTRRAVVATFYAPGNWPDRVVLDEGASHHASVKRLAVGDPVRLTSGDGRRAHGTIAVLNKHRLEVECHRGLVVEQPHGLAVVGDDLGVFLAGQFVVAQHGFLLSNCQATAVRGGFVGEV